VTTYDVSAAFGESVIRECRTVKQTWFSQRSGLELLTIYLTFRPMPNRLALFSMQVNRQDATNKFEECFWAKQPIDF
jgi:hypothetical protein